MRKFFANKLFPQMFPQISRKSVETAYLQKFSQWILPKISSHIVCMISLTTDKSIICLSVQATQQIFTCSKSTIEAFEKLWNVQLTIKTPGWHNWHHSGVIIVNFEDISQCIVGSSPFASVMHFFRLKYFFLNTL